MTYLPVKRYPGHGLKLAAVDALLLFCDAVLPLASLCKALCRSHEPLKQSWEQKKEPCARGKGGDHHLEHDMYINYYASSSP